MCGAVTRGRRGRGSAPGCRGRNRALRRPTRWHQRWQIHEANAAGQARQDIGDVRTRINAGKTACAKNRVRDRCAFALGVLVVAQRGDVGSVGAPPYLPLRQPHTVQVFARGVVAEQIIEESLCTGAVEFEFTEIRIE